MDITIVIPVYNEEESLKRLFDEIEEVISSIGRSAEIVAVDDGSTDSSFDVLKELCIRHKNLTVVRFRGNFGQTAAIAAGFKHARGDVIITMDADWQNDPADIPKLLSKMDEGFDVVSGWRKDRKDTFITRKVPSFFANKLISFITGVPLHDYGCTMKAYKNEIVKDIQLYGQMHRFIPALAKWVGATVGEVEVNHRERLAGTSKYGISRTFRVILDLMTVKYLLSYSASPIQVFGLVGFVSGAAGFLLALYLSVQRLLFGVPLADKPALLLAVMLILIGVQFVAMGLLGEVMTRIHHESQDKSVYAIKETISGDGNSG